jgi:hypothetical protein
MDGVHARIFVYLGCFLERENRLSSSRPLTTHPLSRYLYLGESRACGWPGLPISYQREQHELKPPTIHGGAGSLLGLLPRGIRCVDRPNSRLAVAGLLLGPGDWDDKRNLMHGAG